MSLKPRRPWLALSVGTALLAGCQTTTPLFALKQPLFALGQSRSEPAAVAVAGEVARLPGSLTVSFDGDLARLGLARKRRVLATIADVDHVTVTVKASNGAEFSKTVDKAAIAAGTTSVTFDALPAGPVTVTITAFDGTGAGLGSTQKTAQVLAGQVASVDVALQLNPTYTGAGGGSTTTTGGLTTNVTLADGPSIAASNPGDVLGTYAYGDANWDVAVDGAGNAWVGARGEGTGLGSVGSAVLKVAPDGTLLKSIPMAGAVYTLAVDSQGNAWAFSDETPSDGSNPTSRITKFAPDGTQLASLTHAGSACRLAVAPDGTVYGFTLDKMLKVSPDGALQGEYAIPFSTAPAAVHGAAVAPDGNVWFTDLLSGEVYKVSPSGTKLAEIQMPSASTYPSAATRLAIDAAGQVWVPTYVQGPAIGVEKGEVVKLSPDGTPLGRYPMGNMPTAVTVDPWGYVWVLDENDLTVTRMKSDGTGAVSYLLPIHGCGIGSGVSGVWVGELMGAGVTRLAP